MTERPTLNSGEMAINKNEKIAIDYHKVITRNQVNIFKHSKDSVQ